MAAIEVGRVCVKTAGREAGENGVILDIIDKNFVEVVGVNVKNRRCNVSHLEPTENKIELKSDDIEEIKKELESLE
ncbi:ribosomal protein L14 [Methanothermobacter thermautotrophicus str. Delta H]|uniref:Large ribosomal subunit protein eL14 n=1 Tax=Methanothermobacter thermautotrophicus (strain ATCC 29096 / DSM 1053 / JCM 10044 / NBRC 100330 / Delta H) TaxID=187420 RepID=RL14E_METTH|nr:50S ribosomal protein L14e [Methanothermobacter thermautotrophicus]O26139.1 RecName: Full=Large ribosomal subunit protein eL14; AltName: Full=50S ribosomal protein L14e [Methanothermobacter thermautotrophicus str. Delta H]AAB84540.1 ribosomal protein L14 [Methanothermobacter thermautotrophicus str. Delta H]